MTDEEAADRPRMKAAVYRTYGPPDVVHIELVPQPEPKANEVLVKIRASTVSSGDARVRSLHVPRGFGIMARLALGISGPRKPILGSELSGVIEAVGSAVTKFKVGEAVFAFPGLNMGCHAEYRTMPEEGRILRMPKGLTFAEAAALSFGGTTVVTYLIHAGKIAGGEKALIVGASGAVGSAAVQIAKHFGAEVTGVTSTLNVERVRAIGADHVIDYTQGDYLARGATYDVICDTVGAADFAAYKRALGEQGRLVLIAGSLSQNLSGAWASMTTKHKVIAGPAKQHEGDLGFLGELAESGDFKPLIDRSFPLARIVEAHAYVDTGRKRGSVVITMDTD